MPTECTCPVPFDEDSLICQWHENQWVDGLLAIDPIKAAIDKGERAARATEEAIR